MERCQRLSKRILDDFHAIALPTLRHEAIVHTVSTANAAAMLAMHRHLDRALCTAAAWLHDIALYTKNCRHGIHGEQSAELAVPYLEDAGFSTPEIEQITTHLRALRRDLKLCARIEGDIPKIQASVKTQDPAFRGHQPYSQIVSHGLTLININPNSHFTR